MKDKQKTRRQLMNELESPRQRIAKLEALEGTRKTVEEEKTRFLKAIETTKEAINITTPAAVMLYTNDGMDELFGYKKGELLGKHVSILNAGSRQKAKTTAKDVMVAIKKKGVWEGEIDNKRKDGSEFISFVRITALTDKKGRVINYVSTQHNISERKRTEKALRESQERLRLFMDSASESFLLLDSKMNIVELNPPAWKGMHFRNRKEAIGENILKPLPYLKGTDRYRGYMKVIRTGKPFSKDIFVRHAKLGDRCFAVNAFKVGNGLGIIATDITERKSVEKARQEAHDDLEIRVRERTAELLAVNKELRIQRSALEQKNIALGEIVQQIEIEKNKVKDDVATNVNDLLLPILPKLRVEKSSAKYIDLLQRHLEELSSSFGRKITEKSLKLTPREIEVCNMVRGRLTSKEISTLLNVSRQTVEKHRKNIRRKLGISKKSVNLTSFLHRL